jgi:hypothetical protein
VLRRFELYTLETDASHHGVRALERACRDCGRFIPEVLDSAVGWNRSDAPVQLVWEHAYESAESYRRYMVHPFHASVLDRYILHDSPERIVTANALEAGLVGYLCDGPDYRMSGGLRRLVLLRVRRNASGEHVRRLEHVLSHGAQEAPELIVSVAAANSLGAAWFDGVTPIGPPPRWTHVWEQGFESTEAFETYLAGRTELAVAERTGWQTWMGGLVARAADVYYEPMAQA